MQNLCLGVEIAKFVYEIRLFVLSGCWLTGLYSPTFQVLKRKRYKRIFVLYRLIVNKLSSYKNRKNSRDFIKSLN